MDNVEDHEAYDRREEAPHRRKAADVEQRRDLCHIQEQVRGNALQVGVPWLS
jgi:hypothetical protein